MRDVAGTGNLEIRPERTSDHERVFAIQAAAFGRPNEARLVSALRGSVHPSLSLVAELDGRLAGHVFFSPLSIEGGSPPVGGLAPVGVDPELQRRGVGSALIREGLRRSVEVGWRAIFLLGNPAYYARFGFVLAAPLGFHYRDAGFDAAFQVIELEPGALRSSRGLVHFPEAFALTGTD
jgi:putative acetyltransferase